MPALWNSQRFKFSDKSSGETSSCFVISLPHLFLIREKSDAGEGTSVYTIAGITHVITGTWFMDVPQQET